MATNPTHPPTPLCFFPVASLVDGHRQKGHEPGCGFSKLFHSLYHQGLVPSWELQSGEACLFPHIPISSQVLAAERVSQCKPLWRWLLLCENVCCVLFARFQLESTMGFLQLTGAHSKHLSKLCQYPTLCCIAFSPAQAHTPALRVYAHAAHGETAVAIKLVYHCCMQKQHDVNLLLWSFKASQFCADAVPWR